MLSPRMLPLSVALPVTVKSPVILNPLLYHTPTLAVPPTLSVILPPDPLTVTFDVPLLILLTLVIIPLSNAPLPKM